MNIGVDAAALGMANQSWQALTIILVLESSGLSQLEDHQIS
jgi:hypothetical protein